MHRALARFRAVVDAICHDRRKATHQHTHRGHRYNYYYCRLRDVGGSRDDQVVTNEFTLGGEDVGLEDAAALVGRSSNDVGSAAAQTVWCTNERDRVVGVVTE